MKDLKGRVAVVTGAGSGIGLAMAQRFADEGMKLALADIEAEGLDAALAAVRARGSQAIAVRTDVMSEADVSKLADAAFEAFGAVHLLCNNAGVASATLRTRAWEAPLSDWNWIMGVNFMGVLHGVRAFVPRMLAAAEEGHIVNTASVAGLLTAANPYHVSKHAVTCLTEGIFKDFRSMGAKLSASVLCPGLIRTAIMEAERNRPAHFGPRTDVATLAPDIQRWADGFRSALNAGYEPDQVAREVVDAVRADRFYIVPAQPFLIELIRTRMEEVAEQRNPTVPAPM